MARGLFVLIKASGREWLNNPRDICIISQNNLRCVEPNDREGR